jgi:general nucleoside transport system ATP-binding protein
VLRVSHRIAVLRQGQLVALLPTAQANQASLAEAMVGRQVQMPKRSGAAIQAADGQSPTLRLRGATVRGSAARPTLTALDLDVHAGEVVAIAGVSGNGQASLADVLCGECGLHAGTLTVSGQALPAHARAFVDAGVARIPEDRHAVGLVGDLALWENALLERYRHARFAKLGVIKRGAAMAHAQELVTRFDVRGTDAAGVHTVTRRLSGGNMQKLILGRVLGGDGAAPPLIIANQPTWGLDIGAVAYVHQQLLDAAAAGSAVLVISEDLDEVFALADRIAVMHQGRLTPARPTSLWSRAAIGLAMAGATSTSEGAAHAAA